jgi:hypothetical protein
LVVSAGIIVTSALVPASALAGVTILSAKGIVSELTQVADCPNALCFTRCRNIGGGPVDTTSGQMTFETPDCTFTAPGDETKKASANATVTASATQSSSGDQQTITFKTFAGTGTASYALTDKGSAFVQVQSNFDVEFLITGQAETVTIEPSFNVGGSQRELFARLEGPSGGYRHGYATAEHLPTSFFIKL